MLLFLHRVSIKITNLDISPLYASLWSHDYPLPSVGLYSTGFWRFFGFISKMKMESSNFTNAGGVEKIKPYVLDESELS